MATRGVGLVTGDDIIVLYLDLENVHCCYEFWVASFYMICVVYLAPGGQWVSHDVKEVGLGLALFFG